uniref:Uncharacterized protein n=1 Tax=Mucochytrium quahogii TaxID=96639 RepID=A0A7S2SL54_9STRA|mmetsp:Transcript_12811/g.20722  ORF Transcript_12811/g.20722 Transcript_12811/m.20722 type:complete len:430 (-) Transcript_12811:46-1335(-)
MTPCIKFLFLMLGICAMLPWNTLISNPQFYDERFCGTSIAASALNLFTTVYLTANCVMAIALLFVVKAVAVRILVLGPLVFGVISFTVMSVLAVVPSTPYAALLAIVIATSFFTGCGESIFVSGSANIANRFNIAMMSYVLVGIAFAGVLTSVASLVTTAAAPLSEAFCANSNSTSDNVCAPPPVAWNVFAYFIISVVVCLAGMLSYFVVIKKIPDGGDDSEAKDVEKYDRTVIPSSPSEDTEKSERKIDPKHTMTVIYKVLYHLMTIILTLGATLTIFPGISAKITSLNKCQLGSSRYQNDLFTPVNFLLFNGTDMISRFIPPFWQPFSKRGLFGLSCLRLVLWPLLMLSNVENTTLTVVFKSDVFPIIWFILLGLTNGFLVTSCFIGAPAIVEKHEQWLASTTMQFGVAAGVLAGSCLSYAALAIVS